ncbi:MAG: GNAT family N-acetyltransferase [Actinomycetota bacterium]|nr:GNAT family N-acetyltransferase [Actinomycetota bacterium]
MAPGNTSAAGNLPAPRPADPSDLPGIEEVIGRAYARYAGLLDRPPAPVLHDYRPEIDAGCVWVLGEPIAGLIVLIERDDGLLIENVAVDPAEQGRGLGRVLLEFAEREAAARGLPRLTLYTNEVMTDSLAVYLRLGYHEVDRRYEDGYRRIFLAKPISAG